MAALPNSLIEILHRWEIKNFFHPSKNKNRIIEGQNTIIISQHPKTNFLSSLYIQNSFKKISFISPLICRPFLQASP
jgi:hypothetical protein